MPHILRQILVITWFCQGHVQELVNISTTNIPRYIKNNKRAPCVKVDTIYWQHNLRKKMIHLDYNDQFFLIDKRKKITHFWAYVLRITEPNHLYGTCNQITEKIITRVLHTTSINAGLLPQPQARENLLHHQRWKLY